LKQQTPGHRARAFPLRQAKSGQCILGQSAHRGEVRNATVLRVGPCGVDDASRVAAKRLTIAQLEQLLDGSTRAHRSDLDLARQLSDIELSQRLTEPTFNRLSKHFDAHSKTGAALQLLADQSAFLEPPASELPDTPAPDSPTQRTQLASALNFVHETLPSLPNLLALRTTFSFDGSLQVTAKGGWAERMGLHLVGVSKSEVSVRDDKETVCALEKSVAVNGQNGQDGLVSWGEFGSTLYIVLNDMQSGKIAWDRWEQSATGLISVFHYEVPRSAPHYELVTPMRRLRPDSGTDRWGRTGGARQDSSTTEMVHNKPGYHGALWVDPKSGAILRVSVIADLKGDTVFERGAILVEYGPVRIGNKTFICPVRSLALSAAPLSVRSTLQGATTEWLNENLFSDYHLFASTSRIVTEAAQNAAPPKSGPTNEPEHAPDDKNSITAAPTSRQPEQKPVDEEKAAPSPGRTGISSRPVNPWERAQLS
jgi:hypothetical protein